MNPDTRIHPRMIVIRRISPCFWSRIHPFCISHGMSENPALRAIAERLYWSSLSSLNSIAIGYVANLSTCCAVCRVSGDGVITFDHIQAIGVDTAVGASLISLLILQHVQHVAFADFYAGNVLSGD